MTKQLFTPRFLFLAFLIFVAAFSRLLPHPFNFTPIGAMALFGGACFSDKKYAFAVPLLAMLLSDIALELAFGIGWHNTMFYVYLSFVLITLIGIFIRNRIKAGNIILASLLSSLLFFLLTNFGVWAAGGFQFGLSGLLAAYYAGIPFYNNELFGSFLVNTVAGDLFYNGILFGTLYFARMKFPVLSSPTFAKGRE